MIREIVIDNTALGYFAALNEQMAVLDRKRTFDIFDILSSRYVRVHVPLEVKEEFSRYAQVNEYAARVLNRIEQNIMPTVTCPSYDTFVKNELDRHNYPGIDKGEMEAVAQAEKIKVKFLLTDDMRFVETLRQTSFHIHCISSLCTLAKLDIMRELPFRDTVFGLFLKIYQPPRKNNSRSTNQRATPQRARILFNAYQSAAFHLGIQLNETEMRKKSSIKHLPYLGEI